MFVQGTVRQFLITPRTLDFEEDIGTSNLNQEAGPSIPIQQEERTASDNETVAEMLINLSRPRGITIAELLEQIQALQTSQNTHLKDKGKGILIESKKKKKKPSLADLRAMEIAKGEEAARVLQAELDAEYEKEKEHVIQPQRPLNKAKERNAMMAYLKVKGIQV